MYEVLYGVPPSMVTTIDCERVAAGVFPVKAIDVPANPSVILLKLERSKNATYLQRIPRMSRTLKHWQTQGMSSFHHTKEAAD
jgi:hypothetical protein